MSHWAEIDENNIVLRVLVGSNDEPDEGQAFVESLGGTWIKTSYNGNIRGTYAGIGFSYNKEEDIFVRPKPFDSWTRNGSDWEAPTPYPSDEKTYLWNEQILSWEEIQTPESI
jgi:hypothetical protein